MKWPVGDIGLDGREQWGVRVTLSHHERRRRESECPSRNNRSVATIYKNKQRVTIESSWEVGYGLIL